MNVSCLSNPVAAILCLGVHGRIPVTVVEDNSIGTGQVDAKTTATGGQDETEDALVHVESVH